MAKQNHTDHILPFSLYMKVGATLLLLTGLTTWVAQIQLGEFNLVVAMVIAATKGSLVALFFMHLKYTNRIFAAVFVGALLMLAVFIVFTMFDTMSRGTLYQFEAHPIDSQAVIYRQADSTAVPAAAPAADSAASQGH
jgi:cytochrome c oxidase subunit 4